MTSVLVAVRVRPFTKHQLNNNYKQVIHMEGNTTKTVHPTTGQQKIFTFDYSYWSHDEYKEDPDTGYLSKDNIDSKYIDQQQVFNDLVTLHAIKLYICIHFQGKMVISNAFDGFHTCLFAYGQTGAGKSYSVVGYGGNKGIVPRACDQIFQRITQIQASDSKRKFVVQVSMLQIYNQIVHDLFIHPSKRPKGGLQVRQQKNRPFVKDLTKIHVKSYKDIDKQISNGNTNRTIGATNMNATSSRAHTIVTITVSQSYMNGAQEITDRVVTNINLVDLAGSQRVAATGASGDRLKQGNNINKSLSVLGKVINTLALKSQGKNKTAVVPYRESKLTRILQNNLGGNCKTAMIAAISPAAINFEETLSTLRYAYQVKCIKNKAFINQSPHDRMIKELRNENKSLRKKLDDGLVGSTPIVFQKKQHQGRFHLKNLNQDPLLTGKIRHALDDGITQIGTRGDIEVGGLGVVQKHCEIQLDEEKGVAMLKPNDASPEKNQTLLNGKLVTGEVKLKHLDRIRFGLHNYFLFLDPNEFEFNQYDWDFANQEAIDNNVKDIEKMGHVETQQLKDKLQELQCLMEQKAAIEADLMQKIRKLQEQHQKRMQDIKDKYQPLIQNAGKQEKERLKEKLEGELAELQKAKNQNQRIMNLQNEDLLAALRMKQRLQMEKQLRDMLQKINLINEVCQLMGKYSYMYEPKIQIQTVQGGDHKPVVVCKAYPDRNNKSVSNKFTYSQFISLYYNIMQRWQDYLYDEQPDPKDKFIFGMEISEYWKHLGSSHLYLNGIYNLVDTPFDSTPIIETSGKNNGTLHYSITPKLYHKKTKQWKRASNKESIASIQESKEDNQSQDGMKAISYQDLDDLQQGQRFGFDIVINGAKGLPPQYCYKTFC